MLAQEKKNVPHRASKRFHNLENGNTAPFYQDTPCIVCHNQMQEILRKNT